MAQTEIPVTQSITFPVNAVYYETRINGYRESNTQSPFNYLIDESFGDGNPVSFVEVSYPASKFSAFHTQLSLTTDWSSPNTYFYRYDGTIPTLFKMTDASVTGTSPAPGTIEFSTAGSYNVSNANWKFSAANNQIFDWNIYAPDSIKKLFLPALPPSILHEFPVLKMDSLVLDHIELQNFYGFSTYGEVIDKVFIIDPPAGMEHLEAGSVRVVPSK
jgi:hypothetical protein